EKSRRAGLFDRFFGRGEDERDKSPPETNDDSQTLAESVTKPPPVGEEARAAPTAVETPTSGSAEASESKPRAGWFTRLKAGLARSSTKLSENISGIFTKRKLDSDRLEELEDVLIRADLGVETAMRVTETLAGGRYEKGISAESVRAVLASEIEK